MTELFDPEKYEVVDLTHSMYHRMPGWVDHSQFSVEDERILAVHGYAVKRLALNTHHGTHVDVAAHFLEDGKTLDKYVLEAFMGTALVIDVSDSKPASPIDPSKIKMLDQEIGRDEIVLLYTGWDRLRGHNIKYLYEWPYVDVELAHYFADKKVKAVGTDGLSIGGWGGQTAVRGKITDTSIQVHRILLSNNIVIFEELANLNRLLDGKKYARVFFVGLPLKLDGADGAPVRAIAFKKRG